MKLDSDVEIVGGLPILYVKSLSAIVCSDLHLGYEGVMANKGIFIPKVNFQRIKSMLKRAREATRAESIIIVGDIKNEFSEVHVEEFNEFNDLVKYLQGELEIRKITLIKGNHDNFVDRLERPFGIKIYRQEALIGDILFFHGEELPKSREGRMLIMGHLHPAIAIYNRIGIKEKLRCFLYGKLDDKRDIVVLPAMNYFAEGAEVNNRRQELPPVFNQMLGIGSMKALCLGEDEILDFGYVSDLENL